LKASLKGSTGATVESYFQPRRSGGIIRRYDGAQSWMSAMPWGANNIRAVVSLRVAAAASMAFWLGLIAFIAGELAFGGENAPVWLQPLDDFLIFTVWIAACVATIACIWAMHRLTPRADAGLEPGRKSGVAAAKRERCSVL
jgi:hypothetical protein